MRQTLLFGGLESVAHNINRRCPDTAFYEFGNVYFRNGAKTSTAEAPLAPYSESAHLGMWMSGSTRQANWLRQREDACFYDLKAAVINVLARCGLDCSQVSFTDADTPAGGIFAQALTIKHVNGGTIGTIGMVAGDVLRRCDIKVPVCFAELNWDRVAHLAARRNALYTPLPKTQPVKRDLSLLLDAGTDMAQIQTAVRRCDSKLIHSVSLFDVYEGKNLPAGKKSYAISIEIQDDEKTLQDKHIDKIMSKVTETLRRTFGAELR